MDFRDCTYHIVIRDYDEPLGRMKTVSVPRKDEAVPVITVDELEEKLWALRMKKDEANEYWHIEDLVDEVMEECGVEHYVFSDTVIMDF